MSVKSPTDSSSKTDPAVAPLASTPARRYALISPCRDEAATLRRTLESVLAQSVRPARWIIVDDGSTDATPEILDRYARAHPFIELIPKPDRGERKVGPGVIEAFYAGYEALDPSAYEYVCKLDVDLDLPPRYFETMMRWMESDPRLGTCSGKPYFPPDVLEGEPAPSRATLLRPDGEAFDVSQLVSEGCGDEMSVGMIKFYRRACFEQIGGFVREVMWDGIDGHRCRMGGWKAESRDAPEARFVHLRPMGSSQKGLLTGRMRHGFGQYFMGTSLVYMTASAAFRLPRRPRVIGGAAMWWGYVQSWLARRPRYDDPAFRRFLRRYQRRCLLQGKAAATRRVNEEMARAWTAPDEHAGR